MFLFEDVKPIGIAVTGSCDLDVMRRITGVGQLQIRTGARNSF